MGIVTIHGGIGAKYWGAALLTALIGSVLAFMLYNWSLARVSVGVAGMAINLIPVFGVLFAYIFLGETLQGLAIIGAVLVFLGLALFTWDSRRSSGEPESSVNAEPTQLG
jgi:drug/metabolite transporter (DMT)-like permease